MYFSTAAALASLIATVAAQDFSFDYDSLLSDLMALTTDPVYESYLSAYATMDVSDILASQSAALASLYSEYSIDPDAYSDYFSDLTDALSDFTMTDASMTAAAGESATAGASATAEGSGSAATASAGSGSAAASAGSGSGSATRSAAATTTSGSRSAAASGSSEESGSAAAASGSASGTASGSAAESSASGAANNLVMPLGAAFGAIGAILAL